MVIQGDTELLHRALDNIVRNAMKYANHMVSIRVTRILENKNNMVVIFVEDDGAGIVEQNLGNIFQPFFRSPQHINDKGTGLGLTIAQRAVRLHGGYILARNRPEGGLCVEVRLPAL
jgi:signal transduction histidine kinase